MILVTIFRLVQYIICTPGASKSFATNPEDRKTPQPCHRRPNGRELDTQSLLIAAFTWSFYKSCKGSPNIV